MGLARRNSKMKDMSRNMEGDGRISFKEEMFRRAEETRSLMMSRTGFKVNNDAENGHVGRTSPTGTDHQSAIKIKIEREGEDDVRTEPTYEVGKENYFKVNNEGVSNEKNRKQFQVKNNSDLTEKEIFMNGRNRERPSTLPRTYRGQVQKAGHNSGFDMSKRDEQRVDIVKNGQITRPARNTEINTGLLNSLCIKDEKVTGNRGVQNSDSQESEFENSKSWGNDSYSPSGKSQT